MLANKKPWFIRILLPTSTTVQQRELLSTLALRTARNFSFLGMEDWRAEVPNGEKVLGIEAEFHDLVRFQKKEAPMVIYFSKKNDAEQFGKIFSHAFPELKIKNPQQQAPKDWMKEWRKHYKQVKVQSGKEKLFVIPSWKKSSTIKNALVARISPGQAFGTGTHPTTFLCLEIFLSLADELKKHKKIQILDFGAGTGLLAVAAVKWAKREKIPFHATAIEIDPVALEQCKKNAKLNGVKLLALKKSSSVKVHELVFANVLAPVLLKERKFLQASVKRGGVLLLSGLLANEGERFLQNFLKGQEKKFQKVELRKQGDWCAILLKKN